MANKLTDANLHKEELVKSLEDKINELRAENQRSAVLAQSGKISQKEFEDQSRKLQLEIGALENERTRETILSLAGKEAEAKIEKSKKRGLEDREAVARGEKEKEEAKRKQQEKTGQIQPQTLTDTKTAGISSAPLPSLSIPQQTAASNNNVPEKKDLENTDTREIGIGKFTQINFKEKPGEISYTITSPRNKDGNSRNRIQTTRASTVTLVKKPAKTTTPIATVEANKPTASIKPEDQQKGAPKRNVVTGTTLLYNSSSGFVSGKISPRAKERVFARDVASKAGKEVSKPASSKPANKSSSSTKTELVTSPASTKLELKKSLTQKNPAKPSLLKNILRRIKEINRKRQEKKPSTTTNSLIPSTQRPKKNAKDYQKEWNAQVLVKKKLEGFDNSLLRNWLTIKKQILTRAVPRKQSSIAPSTAKEAPSSIRLPSLKPHPNNNIWSAVQFRSPSAGGKVHGRLLTSTPNNNREGEFLGPAMPPGSRGATRRARTPRSPISKTVSVITSIPQVKIALISGGILAFFVLVVLIIIITLLSGGGSSGEEAQKPVDQGNPPGELDTKPPSFNDEIPGFTLTKIPDKTEASPPEEITYTISYTYTPSEDINLENIIIYDELPTSVEFKSASGKHEYDKNSRTVSWKLSDTENISPLTLVVEMSRDIDVRNKAYALAAKPGQAVIDISSTSLDQIFKDASARSSVPLPFLKAIAKKESGVLGYTNGDVDQFNKPNWFSGLVDNAPALKDNDPLIQKGYAYNTCQYTTCFPGADVRGAMQFEIKTWDSVKNGFSFPDGHSPDRRYVRDVVFGAAELIARTIKQYDSRFGFSQNPNEWTEKQVKALARSYCGGNPDADVANDLACGPYDTIVWDYYREFKASNKNQ